MIIIHVKDHIFSAEFVGDTFKIRYKTLG